MISLSFIAFSSLNKLEELVEQLLVALGQGLGLLAQSRVGQLLGRGAALGHQILRMAQGVFDIKELFGTHVHHLALSICERTAAQSGKNCTLCIGKRGNLW